MGTAFRRAKSSGNRQRGTQLVELALVLPFLLFMGMFVTEGAGFLRMHQVLNNAAREGARLSSLQENMCTVIDSKTGAVSTDPTCPVATYPTITNAVLYYLCANSVSNQNCPDSTNNTATVTINQKIPLLVDGKTVWLSQITVSRPYNLPLMSAIPGFGIPPAITLTTSAQFQDFYGW